MINSKKIFRPFLTVTVLGATAFYGGSAIGQSLYGSNSPESSMNTETGILEVANVTCDDAKASLAAAEKAANSAEAAAEAQHSALLSAMNANGSLQERTNPPATPAELAAAEKRQTDAFGAEEKAKNAVTDAAVALAAAEKAKTSACASGPTYLPNWPAPGPDHPVIAGPVPDVN